MDALYIAWTIVPIVFVIITSFMFRYRLGGRSNDVTWAVVMVMSAIFFGILIYGVFELDLVSIREATPNDNYELAGDVPSDDAPVLPCANISIVANTEEVIVETNVSVFDTDELLRLGGLLE